MDDRVSLLTIISDSKSAVTRGRFHLTSCDISDTKKNKRVAFRVFTEIRQGNYFKLIHPEEHF